MTGCGAKLPRPLPAGRSGYRPPNNNRFALVNSVDSRTPHARAGFSPQAPAFTPAANTKAGTCLRALTSALRALTASIEQARVEGVQVLALLADFHLDRETRAVSAAAGLPDEPP